MTPKPNKCNQNRKKRRGASNGQGGGIYNTKGSLPRNNSSVVKLSSARAIYPYHVHDVDITPIRYTTSAANTCYRVFNLRPDLAPNWTQLAALYNEVRLVGARLRVSSVAATGITGVVLFALDETSSTTPTSSTNIAARPHLTVSVNRTDLAKSQTIEWVAVDLTDLDFVATSAPAIAVYIKAAGDANTSLVAAGTGTDLLLVDGTMRLEFRGYVIN